MNRFPAVLALAAFTLASVAALQPSSAVADVAAEPKVAVSFVKPESFTDAGSEGFETVTADSRNLKELAAYLVQSGDRLLPAGDRLAISFTDIDLAGRFQPRTLQQRDIRLVTDDAWPRMKFHYELTHGGVVSAGDKELIDQNFMQKIGPARGNDALRYEKSMLGDWMKSVVAGEN